MQEIVEYISIKSENPAIFGYILPVNKELDIEDIIEKMKRVEALTKTDYWINIIDIMETIPKIQNNIFLSHIDGFQISWKTKPLVRILSNVCKYGHIANFEITKVIEIRSTDFFGFKW